MKINEWDYEFWKERNLVKLIDLKSLRSIVIERELVCLKSFEFKNEYQRTWILVEH